MENGNYFLENKFNKHALIYKKIVEISSSNCRFNSNPSIFPVKTNKNRQYFD
mgnify:CR=1 FL=1